MMRVRLNVSEFEEELGEEVGDILVDVGSTLVNHLKREAPVGATGDLQRSIQIFRTGRGEVVLGTRIHYAEDVWKGTDPHIVEDFDALQKWARRKLGDESAAGPVFRKIAQEGTDPNDFVGRAIEATLDEY